METNAGNINFNSTFTIQITFMGIIKERFKEKADKVAIEIKDLLKEHGDKKIGEVTLSQIYQECVVYRPCF